MCSQRLGEPAAQRLAHALAVAGRLRLRHAARLRHAWSQSFAALVRSEAQLAMSTTIPVPAQPRIPAPAQPHIPAPAAEPPRVVANAFHAGASPFPITMLPNAHERSLDTITYLVTRRVLTFSTIAAVLLALCLQSSTGAATWWSEGSTFGYSTAAAGQLVGLLQADLYNVAYTAPAAVNPAGLDPNRPAGSTGFGGGAPIPYSSWWIAQGVR